MKNITSLLRTFMVGIGLIAVLLLNFSFKTERYIEVPSLDKADLTTSACVIVQLIGQEYQYFRNEHSVRLYNIDSCKIGLRLPGYYSPGEPAPMTTKYPQKDVTVGFQFIEYILPQPITVQKGQTMKHNDFPLRFLAVSAPQWVSYGNAPTSYALDSRTPFSLQNAVRLGAKDALMGNSVWSKSNWSQQDFLRDAVCLMNYYEEEKDVFIQKLKTVQPHVLFIGSMTLSFPGAIAIAKAAKQELGDAVFVVLGGKHSNETTYLSHNTVEHHVGSATLLMQQQVIPQVFDLVVSGDGEEVIQKIGEIIGNEILSGNPIKAFSAYEDHFHSVRGNFILSWNENNSIKTLVKQKNLLDYESLPSPVSLFGVNTRFPIFGKEYTAHAYSDMGKGCVFNCFFCSECSAINGPTIQSGSPARRLYRQLEDAANLGSSMSAFVEDSIMLMGLPKHLNELAYLLEQHPLNIVFGGQFTVDNLLNPDVQSAIQRLSKVGLMYIFTGMETSNEAIATEMSKNTVKKNGWMDRNEDAIRFVTRTGLKYGVSILWGLGESQDDRLHQLDVVTHWQKKYNNPRVVSPNWATQHPLFNKSSFTYSDWGTEKTSKYLPYFVQLFGEASELYKLSDGELPSITDLQELLRRFEVLNIQNV